MKLTQEHEELILAKARENYEKDYAQTLAYLKKAGLASNGGYVALNEETREWATSPNKDGLPGISHEDWNTVIDEVIAERTAQLQALKIDYVYQGNKR